MNSGEYVRPRRWVAAVVLCLSISSPAQLSTTDHLADPGFWPTQNGVSRDDYTGPQACASCHANKAASQKTTAMAQNAMRAQDSEILKQHPKLNFNFGKYLYEIRTERGSNTYSVTDGTQTISAPLVWAFGVGRAAQSYLFEKDGRIHEARATYFDALHNLDFTPARSLESAKDIEEAMGRPVPAEEVERCFACHTTASTMGTRFEPDKLIPGVSCEACHGPGAKHVAAAKVAAMSGMPDAARGTIFNPSQLEPADAVDFCGACHSTFWDVKLRKAGGVSTVKAQPFRLEESKCWGKGDTRLTCFSCHDPHLPLQKDAASYDPSCLKCHSSSAKKLEDKKLKGCPVATSKCTTCHMPKVNVPEMHYAFTDHRIRIARDGEPYPD